MGKEIETTNGTHQYLWRISKIQCNFKITQVGWPNTCDLRNEKAESEDYMPWDILGDMVGCSIKTVKGKNRTSIKGLMCVASNDTHSHLIVFFWSSFILMTIKSLWNYFLWLPFHRNNGLRICMFPIHNNTCSISYVYLPFTDMTCTLATEKVDEDESSWDSEVSSISVITF